jgi:hypothetical protein
MNLSTRHLAQILIGIARAQQAIIDAMEASRRGFKGTHLAPALDAAAKIRATGRPLTLNELPSRVLLQCQGRTGPDLDLLMRDLESLLNDGANTVTAEDDGNDLDMTKAL